VQEPDTDEQIEKDYRTAEAAAPHGQEAVRKAIQEISPGNPDWIQSGWDLIKARQETRPRFYYNREGRMFHWSAEEGVLRKVLYEAGQARLRTARGE
jgi:hypothetical protein